MSENITVGKEDEAMGLMYVKRLDLINPGSRSAQEYDFQLDRPALISTTGRIDNQLVYSRAGQVVEVPQFAPSCGVGIEFKAILPNILTFGNMTAREIERWSWVAFVEAIGNVYTGNDRSDSRYAQAVRVKELRVYCFGCSTPVTRDRPMNESLKQGLAVEQFHGLNGEGQLGAICSLDKHPRFADLTRYKFSFSEEDEFILTQP